MEDNNTLSHTVDVLDPDSEIVPNLCYLKPATATSQESENLGASRAVDGDFSTRWSSDFYDPQTISVDLLNVYNLETVVLAWETAYSSEYKLEVSLDGNEWTTLVHELQADGGNDTFYPDVAARYIRVVGMQRATEWGHSLWEIQAFGDLIGPAGIQQPAVLDIQVIPNPAQDALSLQGLPGPAEMELFDMNGQRLWEGTVRNGVSIELPRLRMPSGLYVIRLEGADYRSSLNLIVD